MRVVIIILYIHKRKKASSTPKPSLKYQNWYISESPNFLHTWKVLLKNRQRQIELICNSHHTVNFLNILLCPVQSLPSVVVALAGWATEVGQLQLLLVNSCSNLMIMNDDENGKGWSELLPCTLDPGSGHICQTFLWTKRVEEQPPDWSISWHF